MFSVNLNAILMLTDGEPSPNYNPAEGFIGAYQAYMKSRPDVLVSLNTFGFGYKLDSALLTQLAEVGQGMYVLNK